MAENEDAIIVFSKVYNQAIFGGMGTPIDVDHRAIGFIMELYEIENRRDCFEKVTRVWHEVMSMQRLKKKSKEMP